MTRILVIDDNDLVSGLLKEHLSQEGYEVAIAIDANDGYAQALELLPDLILLDIQLPDVMGLDLIRVIKNRDQLMNIPIIMITGTHHQTDYKVRAFKAGADDYVLKPFEMPELVERIRAVLRRSESREKPSAPLSTGPGPLISSNPARAMVPLAKNTPVVMMGGNGSPRGEVPGSAHLGALDLQSLIPLGKLLEKNLFDPWKMSKETQYPRLALTYFLTALGLVLLGVFMTAGGHIKPIIAGLWVMSAWGAAVATLVMSCSIMGLHLNWKEGAHLISLSGIPILMKIAGGTVLACLIGISPFYFTAGPALFWRELPWALGRLDLFEIWSTVLLWIFLRQRPGGSRRLSWVATILVWLVSASLAAILSILV